MYEDAVLTRNDVVTILGVMLDAKLISDLHKRVVVSSTSRESGILRKLIEFIVTRPFLPAASVDLFFLYLSIVHRCAPQLLLVIRA